MSEFDIVNLFLKVGEKNGGRLFGFASNNVKRVADIFRTNFSNYFDETVRTCMEVHTIFDRGNPLDLREIYQPCRLSHTGKKISETKFRSNLIDLPDGTSVRCFLVIGSAGTGKTMLMRHLFLNLIENMESKIPFYIPLRKFNTFTESTELTRFLHSVATNYRADISHEVFKNELGSGGFIFLLDGLDEVDPGKRNAIKSQLLNMQHSYPRTTFVITSRADEDIITWSLARIHYILPMAKSDILSLIKKLPYRKDFKKQFLDDVDSKLFDEHESFLSNPLLASIMLLTYGDVGKIPERIHLFYEQAFETLFYRHDTMKEAGFSRKHYCDLPINRFCDCLSSFCAATYKKMDQEFTRSSVLNYIRKAIEFENLDTPEEMFLNDLLETVSIMQIEGVHIKFIHRSFQEYFAALFLTRTLPIEMEKLLDEFCERHSDNVIPMAMDINRGAIDRAWIIPKLSRLLRALRRSDDKIFDCCRSLFQDVVLELSVLDKTINADVIGLKQTNDLRFLRLLLPFYREAKAIANIELSVKLSESDIGEFQRWWINKRGLGGLSSEKQYEKFLSFARTGRHPFGSADNEWLCRTSLADKVAEITAQVEGLLETVEGTIRHQRESSISLFW